ncbi:MAG: PVC-type heme-binding CxxCH protein [Pirellulales bacterium]
MFLYLVRSTVLLIYLLLLTRVSFAGADSHLSAESIPAEQPFPIPAMTSKRTDVAPFETIDVGAKIPYYIPDQPWGSQGEPRTSMQQPLPPAESQKHFVTPEGFRVELFASEPDLGGKPIAMTWDERGRLFVCETYDYPNELQPQGKGRDRIRICTDTDHDGKADEFKVFAENLSIPTALVACRGGLIVQNGRETLFLSDVDGDDRADVREVLIENWNVRDTHGGVSNFRLGLDNWIWGIQGYNDSEPVIHGEKQQSFRMGFFRFRLDESDPPRVAEFEFIRSTNNNTWGLGLSEEGLVFGSTANHNPSVFMPIPNRYYERVLGWTKSLQLRTIADTHRFDPITDKVRQVDAFGGYTAGAGHALYTARRYPKEYWNRTAFVTGPTGHLVGTFVLTPRGSDFRSTSPFNLLASDDEWTAPIGAEVGPDGNVWVIDWYNFIVQHNPTPAGFTTGQGGAYESDLRDKKHGRIYRVVYGVNEVNETNEECDLPSLGDATDVPSVALLKHPTMLRRLQAQWLIVEQRNAAILPALLELVSNREVDSIGLNVGAMHALWTMHGLGLLDGTDAAANNAVLTALGHGSAGVRRAAIQVLPQCEESAIALHEQLMLQDTDPQVRLAVLLRLADLPPTPDAGQQLVEIVQRPENLADAWIPDAAICAAANNSETFLAALCEAKNPSEQLLLMATIVANHYACGDSIDRVLALGQQLVAAEPAVAGAVIGGLVKGWPMDRTLASTLQVDEVVDQLSPRLAIANRGLLLQLARRWGSSSLDERVAKVRQSLLEQFNNSSTNGTDRIVIAEQMVSLDPSNSETASSILEQITPQIPPKLGMALLRTFENSESSELGELLLANFGGLTPALRSTAIGVLLARPALTIVLLKTIGSDTIQLSDLSLDQQQMLNDHPDASVQKMARKVLRQGGVLPNPDRQRVIDELMATVIQDGDASAGQLVFKKHCVKCHKHYGEGENIGPDLTGMAVHPKGELLTHILDPNRSVEGNFRTYTVVTTDGRIHMGMLAAESRTTIELIDTEGKRETLLRKDIDELECSTKSLMPEGFEKQVTHEELRDLLDFLTQRGQPR